MGLWGGSAASFRAAAGVRRGAGGQRGTALPGAAAGARGVAGAWRLVLAAQDFRNVAHTAVRSSSESETQQKDRRRPQCLLIHQLLWPLCLFSLLQFARTQLSA